VQSYDAATWRFPAIRGRLRCAGGGFHFFDAPDDFSATKLDLLFEGERLYLHGAQGMFGAVPISVTGARAVPGWPAPHLRTTSRSALCQGESMPARAVVDFCHQSNFSHLSHGECVPWGLPLWRTEMHAQGGWCLVRRNGDVC
jgi:hypothetical protein